VIMKGFAVIGAGKLGTTLGHALLQKGFDLRALVCRTMRSARESAAIAGGGKPMTDMVEAANLADTVFLCVPDDAIRPAATRLAAAPLDWRGKTVFHTSGLVSSDALAPLGKRGAMVASFHPAQAFPRKEARAGLFRGIAFGIEGTPKASRAGAAIARRLGGHIVFLAQGDKPLYHAACVMAAAGLTAVLDAAVALLESRGLGEREAEAILLPLAQRSLQNVKEVGAKAALTGPFVRGDAGTISRHLDALRRTGGTRALYKAMGLATVDLAKKKGVPAARLRPLKKLLEDK
jgi:predicted short-subunit dehydrogenase-like oxidoreductase (DUF2520 family)